MRCRFHTFSATAEYKVIEVASADEAIRVLKTRTSSLTLCSATFEMSWGQSMALGWRPESEKTVPVLKYVILTGPRRGLLVQP